MDTRRIFIGQFLALAGAGAMTVVLGVSACSTQAQQSTQANQIVCQHYLKQYQWKQGLTFPTIADAMKWEEYVTADSFEATHGSKLWRDLGNEVGAMRGIKGRYVNGTVLRDCGGQ